MLGLLHLLLCSQTDLPLATSASHIPTHAHAHTRAHTHAPHRQNAAPHALVSSVLQPAPLAGDSSLPRCASCNDRQALQGFTIVLLLFALRNVRIVRFPLIFITFTNTSLFAGYTFVCLGFKALDDPCDSDSTNGCGFQCTSENDSMGYFSVCKPNDFALGMYLILIGVISGVFASFPAVLLRRFNATAYSKGSSPICMYSRRGSGRAGSRRREGGRGRERERERERAGERERRCTHTHACTHIHTCACAR